MEGVIGPVIAGLDTHKKEHSLCLLDGLGRKVFEGFFPANERGYAAIAEAIGDPQGCIVVGVECTMTYGAGVCRHLVAKGYNVVEVLNPEKKRKRRPGDNKNDLEDAERAARTAIEGKYTSTPKAGDGWVEALRCLTVSRRAAVKASTAAANAVKALLTSAPEHVKKQFSGMGAKEMMTSLSRKRTKKDVVEEGLFASLRSLALMWTECQKQADEAKERMGELLEENAPALLAIEGCGPMSAAALAVAAGDNPDRMGSKHSFAALCGVSPVDASSADVKRHRLNRGGNRQANCALYHIAVSRLKYDERTKAYAAKRKADGKSKKETLRCLKRYISNEVYRALLNPRDVPEQRGPVLRELRISLGLTQREVAPLLNLSQANVSALELGRKRSRALEMRYGELLDNLAKQEDPVASARLAVEQNSRKGA
ncbi:MAG: IS110 family transposase [Coriobacteriales bacterium]